MSEHGDLICLKPDKAINAAIDDDVKVMTVQNTGVSTSSNLKLLVSLYDSIPYISVSSYGHAETVSSPNHKLN